MSDEQKTELLHESKRTIFDMNNLHPEIQNRLRMLGFITIDTNGEQQEATNDKIDAILRKTMQSEDPNILADKYMMKHSLYELFKTLTTKIVLNRPADPIGFMINDLEKTS